jgi:cytochrome P450
VHSSKLVPCLKPGRGWLARNLVSLFTEPLRFFSKAEEEIGPLVHLDFGPRQFYLIHEPDLIEEILVTRASHFEKFPRIPSGDGLFGEGLLTSEEPLHMRQRRIMQPQFYRERLAEYGNTMGRCAQELEDRLQPSDAFDIAAELNHATLDIVTRTLFDADTRGDSATVARELEIILRMLNRLVLPGGSLLLKLPLPQSRRYRQALQRMDAIIYRLIEERTGVGSTDRSDLLSILAAAEDPETGRPMPLRQLRDEAITLMVAGHETTANALAWAIYLLTQHSEIQEMAAREASQALGNDTPSAAHYPQLPFVETVFRESMRLFPSVWILGRRALEPFELGTFVAPRGAVFLVCIHALHRSKRLWNDAGEFRPDRWPAAAKNRYAYLPFGAGARLCIGERFAWMEGVLILAALLRRARFTLAADQKVEPEGLLTLRLKHGLRVQVELRDAASI